jgi:hypothetical protein
MRNIREASDILNSLAPPGERLAYLNPEEEALLRSQGGAGQEWVAGIPSYWKPFKDPFGKKKAARQAQEAQEAAITEAEKKARDQENRGNRQAWATDMVSRGKGELFDFTDDLKLEQFMASPGDENYVEGFSQGGEAIDPFPDYAEKTGDLILDNMEGTAEALPDFIGDARSRMEGFQDTFDQSNANLDSAVSALSDVYDPNGMTARMEGYNSDINNVLDELKGINTATAARTRELNENYGDSLAGSVNTEVDYANKEFDALRNASDAALAGEQAKAAVGRRNASMDAASGMRGLNSMGGSTGTGGRMASMMMNAERGMRQSDLLADALINESQRRGEIESGRYEKIGEINPAMADVYRDEVMLKMGTPELDAQATNLGIDESKIMNESNMYDEIMNRQLGNVDAITGIAMNKALLPSLFGEAALAPTDPLKNEVSPFTTTGALAPGQTNFSETPFNPAPIPESGGIDWVKALKAAPDIINQGKKIFNG